MKKYWMLITVLLLLALALAGCTGSDDDDDDGDDGGGDEKETKNLDYAGYLSMVGESNLDLKVTYVIKDKVTEINTTFTESYVYVKFASSGDNWSLWDPDFSFEIGDTIEWEYHYKSSTYTWHGMHMTGDHAGGWMSAEAKKV